MLYTPEMGMIMMGTDYELSSLETVAPVQVGVEVVAGGAPAAEGVVLLPDDLNTEWWYQVSL